MAIIWQTRVADTHYEVRAAGQSIRLYTNGVFHTQYHPKQIVTGSVWDLLLLPAYFHALIHTQRVLVLGVGGGALIHQLVQFTDAQHIVGVDVDPIHLKIARRFFNLKHERMALFEADARAWVEQYRGPKFNLIVEDLYDHHQGEPARGVIPNGVWFAALKRCLSANGTLVMNFATREEFKTSAFCTQSRSRRSFRQAYGFSTPHCDNLITAFLRRDSSTPQLRKRLAAQPLLDVARSDCRLRYRVRKMSL